MRQQTNDGETGDPAGIGAEGRGPVDTVRYHVPNLDRALRILEFLAAEPSGCGISEIARRLTLPKNSVFRIVSTLHAHGYLERDPAGKDFRLSRKLLALGYAAIDEHNLVQKSLDQMRLIRDRTGETTLIGALVGHQGVVLEQIAGSHVVKVLVDIGHRFPLHTAAPGKAMLAFLPPDECKAILDEMPFTRFNQNTITDRARFLEELEDVRAKGYAVDRGEEVEGLHCVAAAVFNHRGRPLASIWVTGPSSRLRLEDFPQVGALVIEKADAISRRFGYAVL
jgi:DNA-binding IclR family transcriptional regulator